MYISPSKHPPVVTERVVSISSIELVLAHDDVEVWVIHCKTKYPTVQVVGSEAILLDEDADTLYGNHEWTYQSTEVAFPDRKGDWEIVCDERPRFDIRVCRYRIDQTM